MLDVHDSIDRIKSLHLKEASTQTKSCSFTPSSNQSEADSSADSKALSENINPVSESSDGTSVWLAENTKRSAVQSEQELEPKLSEDIFAKEMNVEKKWQNKTSQTADTLMECKPSSTFKMLQTSFSLIATLSGEPNCNCKNSIDNDETMEYQGTTSNATDSLRSLAGDSLNSNDVEIVESLENTAEDFEVDKKKFTPVESRKNTIAEVVTEEQEELSNNQNSLSEENQPVQRRAFSLAKHPEPQKESILVSDLYELVDIFNQKLEQMTNEIKGICQSNEQGKHECKTLVEREVMTDTTSEMNDISEVVRRETRMKNKRTLGSEVQALPSSNTQAINFRQTVSDEGSSKHIDMWVCKICANKIYQVISPKKDAGTNTENVMHKVKSEIIETEILSKMKTLEFLNCTNSEKDKKKEPVPSVSANHNCTPITIFHRQQCIGIDAKVPIPPGFPFKLNTQSKAGISCCGNKSSIPLPRTQCADVKPDVFERKGNLFNSYMSNEKYGNKSSTQSETQSKSMPSAYKKVKKETGPSRPETPSTQRSTAREPFTHSPSTRKTSSKVSPSSPSSSTPRSNPKPTPRSVSTPRPKVRPRIQSPTNQRPNAKQISNRQSQNKTPSNSFLFSVRTPSCSMQYIRSLQEKTFEKCKLKPTRSSSTLSEKANKNVNCKEKNLDIDNETTAHSENDEFAIPDCSLLMPTKSDSCCCSAKRNYSADVRKKGKKNVLKKKDYCCVASNSDAVSSRKNVSYRGQKTIKSEEVLKKGKRHSATKETGRLRNSRSNSKHGLVNDSYFSQDFHKIQKLHRCLHWEPWFYFHPESAHRRTMYIDNRNLNRNSEYPFSNEEESTPREFSEEDE